MDSLIICALMGGGSCWCLWVCVLGLPPDRELVIMSLCVVQCPGQMTGRKSLVQMVDGNFLQERSLLSWGIFP